MVPHDGASRQGIHHTDLTDATVRMNMKRNADARKNWAKGLSGGGTNGQVDVKRVIRRVGTGKWALTSAARAAVRRAVHGQQRSVTEAKWPGLTVSLPPMGEASSSAVALAAAGCPSKAKDVERVKDAAVAEAREVSKHAADAGQAEDTANAWGPWTLAMVGAALGVRILVRQVNGQTDEWRSSDEGDD